MTEDDLAGFPYGELLNVARSAGLDVSGKPQKDDLIERMTDAEIEYDAGTWRQDGETIERLPVQANSGSDGPRDKTILYCLPREATTDDRIEGIRDGLDEAGYELRETDSDGGNLKIVEPAEHEGDASDE